MKVWMFSHNGKYQIGADAPPEASEQRPGYLRGHQPALDGVRGIAILMVLVYHFVSLPNPQGLVGRVMAAGIHSMWAGVDLFFVLSGFLITGILLDSKASPNYFGRFYFRRVLRIFPVYYFVVAGSFLLAVAGWIPRGTNLPTALSAYLAIFFYCTNFVAAVRGEGIFGSLFPFWSLAVEEHFYLVWPLIVYFLKPLQLMLASVGIIAIAVISRALCWGLAVRPGGIYCLTFCRMDTLAVGGLIAIWLRWRRPAKSTADRVAWVMVAGSLLGLVGLNAGSTGSGLRNTDWAVQNFGFPLVAILMAGFLMLALTSDAKSLMGRVFRGRVLRWYGKYSYGIYIFHAILVSWLIARLDPHLMGRLVGVPKLDPLLRPVVGIAGASAMGWLSWQLIERHFVAMKDGFSAVGPRLMLFPHALRNFRKRDVVSNTPQQKSIEQIESETTP